MRDGDPAQGQHLEHVLAPLVEHQLSVLFVGDGGGFLHRRARHGLLQQGVDLFLAEAVAFLSAVAAGVGVAANEEVYKLYSTSVH